MKKFEEVLAEISKFKEAETVETREGWSVSEVLQHCAQSIEFSISGFPKQKSPLFKKTLGHFVMKRFLKKGAMKHNLMASIPGGPPLTPSLSWPEASDRLIRAIEMFQNHQGPTADHFAYGPVSKQDYEALHAMHFADHLKEFKII